MPLIEGYAVQGEWAAILALALVCIDTLSRILSGSEYMNSTRMYDKEFKS
jgi:hypothetical protein